MKINYKTKILALSIFILGIFVGSLADVNNLSVTADDFELDDQSATIRAIQQVNPSVVSIVLVAEESTMLLDPQTGETTIVTEKIQKGQGTGFIISDDGYILTNRHVVKVDDLNTAEYKVILNTGKQYYAQFIGNDVARDIAVLKIFDKDLPYVEIGDSDSLQLGTTVIAIGNSMGKYKNSATKGIISGLDRFIVANDAAGDEGKLDNVIQTDAEINLGNSGGPLIDLNGKVVGVNVAIDTAGTAIGFAIPINDVAPVINSMLKHGVIKRAKLGLYYEMLNPIVAESYGLTQEYGALVQKGTSGEKAVVQGGPADLAGIEDGDIILEINAIKIEGKITLFSIIQKYNPGDRIGLRILRGDKILIKEVVLGAF